MVYPWLFTAAARRLRAVFISALLVLHGPAVGAVDALAPSPAILVTPAPVSGSPPAAAPAATSTLAPSKPVIKMVVARPLWADLTPMQQQALAPLASEWDKIDGLRKKKWMEIGNKFSDKKPDEQIRIHERMREWAKLTPDQRRVARDSYSRTKKLNSDQKSAQWQEYQKLSEEQKKNLASDAVSKKPVANLPSALSKPKMVPPIKSTPKPVLERSVTPQATNQSVIQPSPPPSPPIQPVTRP